MFENKVILTGIKPTGTPHFGNYVGAIKPILDLAMGNNSNNTVIIFIADLHALNSVNDATKIAQYTNELVATLLALGLDPSKVIFFRQSDVPEISQLTSLLMNVTPKGLMNRAHSYKDKIAKNTTAGLDIDANVNMGLYTYPVLMAADILLYGSDIVPVGRDQKQHVEFARDIAGALNAAYGGDVLKLPNSLIKEETGLIPGLDGRKMSKSYNNQIPIFASESELKKLVMKIITDSKTPDEIKNPDESTIFSLYKHFADESEIADFRTKFLTPGMGYGMAKTILFEKINQVLKDKRLIYEDLINNPATLEASLLPGITRARLLAASILDRVSMAMLGRKISLPV